MGYVSNKPRIKLQRTNKNEYKHENIRNVFKRNTQNTIPARRRELLTLAKQHLQKEES